MQSVLSRSLAVLLLAVTCSCSGSRPGASSPTEQADWSDLPFLGAALRTPDVRLERAASAHDAKLNGAFKACMEARGYKVTLPDGSADSTMQFLANSARPPDERTARTRGLNVVESWRRLSEPSGGAISVQPTGDTQESMAAGDACLGSAADNSGETRFDELIDSYRSEVMKDRPIDKARGAWRTCMTDRGFESRDINEVVALVNTQEAAAERAGLTGDDLERYLDDAFRREVDIALAVVACDREAYFPVLSEWRSDERAWMDKHAAEIGRLDDRFRLFWAAFVGI